MDIKIPKKKVSLHDFGLKGKVKSVILQTVKVRQPTPSSQDDEGAYVVSDVYQKTEFNEQGNCVLNEERTFIENILTYDKKEVLYYDDAARLVQIKEDYFNADTLICKRSEERRVGNR